MTIAEICYRIHQKCILTWVKSSFLKKPYPNIIPSYKKEPKILPHFVGMDECQYIQDAEDILDGKVTLFASRQFNVGKLPSWNLDPLTGVVGPSTFGPDISIKNRKLVGDIKHVWELNRHLHLVRLAQAWKLSGNRRYLDGLVIQIRSWLDQCPLLIGPNWTSSLELGIRLINWALIWQLLGGFDGVLFEDADGKDLRERWLESIFGHCQFISRHLSRHSSANNHLIGELTGLYVAAQTWPFWDQSGVWATKAKRELEREIVVQHSEDGVNREQAFAYQVFSAEFLAIAGILSHLSDDSFSTKFWDILQANFRFLRSIRDVEGHVPMVGDADDGMVFVLEPTGRQNRARMLLALGDAIFGKGQGETRPDTVRWLLGDTGYIVEALKNGQDTDWNFSEGGYLLFGSGFGEPCEVKGVVDSGPVGYLGIAAHGHADALAIILTIGGEECLVDPGTYSYWSSLKWRNYFRGTSAHNTVRVDGLDQSVSGGRFMWTRKAKVTVEKMPLSSNRFHFVGSHDGYMRLSDRAQHVRTIKYDDSKSSLLVRDDVFGRVSHEVEQLWHFAPNINVELNHNVATVTGKRFTMEVSFSGINLSSEVVRGDETQPLGWFSRTYESKEPTSVLRIQANAKEVTINTKFNVLFKN